MGIRYGVAVVVTVVALFARYLMTPEWGVSLPFITLYPAIAFSAWFGGFGSGVLTTCLGALAVASCWPAHFGGTSTAGDALALLLFGAVGIFVSSLTRVLHQARERAERTADALRLAREKAERANHAKVDVSGSAAWRRDSRERRWRCGARQGIAAEDLARIFGLFTRAGGRREGGFGIGLAVARSLVELQGGTIHAHSEGPGRGSEFRITLPVCDVPRAMAHSA